MVRFFIYIRSYSKFNKFIKALKHCKNANGYKPKCKECIACNNKELCRAVPMDRTTMINILKFFKELSK